MHTTRHQNTSDLLRDLAKQGMQARGLAMPGRGDDFGAAEAAEEEARREDLVATELADELSQQPDSRMRIYAPELQQKNQNRQISVGFYETVR